MRSKPFNTDAPRSILVVLLGVIAASAFGGCRTETIPVSIEFRDAKHIINTDRGRLLVLDTELECADIRGFVESMPLSASTFDTALIDEDRNMCDFTTEFEVPEWPEGLYTVVFYGYDLDASNVSLWSCSRQRLDSVSLTVGTSEGYDKDRPARCVTVPARCGGGCVVDV